MNWEKLRGIAGYIVAVCFWILIVLLYIDTLFGEF